MCGSSVPFKMFYIVLYQPEIPPNTGNIIRLCANTGASLHLIRPLGFTLDDQKLRRAGLDYRERISITVHDSLEAFRATAQPSRLLAFSTRGGRYYDSINYQVRDALLFGPETRGLPVRLLTEIGTYHTLRIPMCPDSRSMNLSNAVAVVLYEAWRSLGFVGA